MDKDNNRVSQKQQSQQQQRQKQSQTQDAFLDNLPEKLSTIGPALLLLILIIAANQAGSLFGCDVRNTLKKGLIAKHMIILALIFLFVTFDQSEKHPLIQVLFTVLVYLWFILIMRSTTPCMILSLGLLLLLVVIRSYKHYQKHKQEPEDERLEQASMLIAPISFFLALVGFVINLFQTRKFLGNKWNFSNFWLAMSDEECDKLSKNSFKLLKTPSLEPLTAPVERLTGMVKGSPQQDKVEEENKEEEEEKKEDEEGEKKEDEEGEKKEDEEGKKKERGSSFFSFLSSKDDKKQDEATEEKADQAQEEEREMMEEKDDEAPEEEREMMTEKADEAPEEEREMTTEKEDEAPEEEKEMMTENADEAPEEEKEMMKENADEAPEEEREMIEEKSETPEDEAKPEDDASPEGAEGDEGRGEGEGAEGRGEEGKVRKQKRQRDRLVERIKERRGVAKKVKNLLIIKHLENNKEKITYQKKNS